MTPLRQRPGTSLISQSPSSSSTLEVRDSQPDISKAQRLLGYQPIVSFEDGLKKILDSYRSSQVTVA